MIAAFAADIVARIERVRPIDDVMQSAAAIDPDIADLRARMQENRFTKLRTFIEWLAANGALRQNIDVDEAATIVWTLTSPEVNRLLRDVRGWSLQRYQPWLEATLLRLLLPQPRERQASRVRASSERGRATVARRPRSDTRGLEAPAVPQAGADCESWLRRAGRRPRRSPRR